MEEAKLLKLTNITKDYVLSGENTVHALKGISVNFRKNEFVAILGPSGCGKTTLLNIIGGLDRYTSGDLSINGVSTSAFTDGDWDAYRNYSVGFVFQNYNLITHQTVLANVELALTLSGISISERKKRAIQALNEVGLADHMDKLPNQLSGGEMQRVAIARAIVNDPDILLADEPTGALDSNTGVQIMEIIKKISENRLVIMVSHNASLSEKYATRIITIKDGLITGDTQPYEDDSKETPPPKRKRIAMDILTAFQLSLKNLFTKKVRTIITAIAGSIGIIGVGLVLSVQNGMGTFMNDLSMELLNQTPISITAYVFSDINSVQNEILSGTGLEQYPDGDIAYPYKPDSSMETLFKKNNDISSEYVDYIKQMDPSIYIDMTMNYSFIWNLVTKHYYEFSTTPYVYEFTRSSSLGWSKIPSDARAQTMYELIGTNSKYPTAMNELAIVVDSYNRVDYNYLISLGIEVNDELMDENGTISFDDIIGAKVKWVPNNVYYNQSVGLNNNTIFTKTTESAQSLYESDKTVELTVVGILRRVSIVEDTSNMASAFMSIMDSNMNTSAILYTQALEDYVTAEMSNSDIAKTLLSQQETRVYYDITTGSYENSDKVTFSESDNLQQCKTYGAMLIPASIYIYPSSFESKYDVTAYLQAWNDMQIDDSMKVQWSDMETVLSYMNGTIDIVSIVLAVFAGISLVVSSVMIGVITYVSVVERTKEIGILRSLGARKQDIANVFNAETVLIGLTAGIIGVIVSGILTIPINALINSLTKISVGSIANLNFFTAILLVLLSATLTLIAGLIPSGIAARKDPVAALRTE